MVPMERAGYAPVEEDNEQPEMAPVQVIVPDYMSIEEGIESVVYCYPYTYLNILLWQYISNTIRDSS